MVKKKVDSRVRILIENGVLTHHRSLFVIVGDHGKDQIVNLHYILTKCQSHHSKRPSVLWCYKKDLGFTTHKQKRMRKLKKDIQRGIRSADEESPFEMFIGATDIRYCYYKETERILGNTFGMAILQDFPSLTPNIIARTVETVEGGGIICILLKTMTSLKQLFAMTMDVHNRFRTESHQNVCGRFNERFLLTLSQCRSALVVDDELNILPISSHINNIKPISLPSNGDDEGGRRFVSVNERELEKLKESLKETLPVGALVNATRTLDQAKAVLTFIEAISEKTLRSTVALTSGRGRGKSAALGLAIAGAVAYGYSNIFVTAPSPENLKTLFEMILKGFEELELKPHHDFEVVHSLNPEHNKAVVRINIYHTHRQTIQYIDPHESNRLSQAELLCIDEAAAIPLDSVKKLLGNYLVFMSSTVHGYEGTGRALSLKLIKQLRSQSQLNSSLPSSDSSSSAGRILREVQLDEPIRYSTGDPIEEWLNDLLCLNCTSSLPPLHSSPPHPSQCELFYVDRDTLFSHHKASESFLQRMMALYVSSHYKNSPNDLQLMSDAPAHHLFVLLGPPDPSSNQLPDILCVIQVCLEGAVSKQSAVSSLQTGARAAGDLIPWTISQQFQNDEFATLSGARIVRIAVHPECGRMGYGTRAIELLTAYYEGKIVSLNDHDDDEVGEKEKRWKEERDAELKRLKELEAQSSSPSSSDLLTETIGPRRHLPPLLNALTDRRSEFLHYIGTSYGLTLELFNFWKKSDFYPLYVRMTASQLTGEHTCVMVRAFNNNLSDDTSPTWLPAFYFDFCKRFSSSLSYDFKSFSSTLALSILVDTSSSPISSKLRPLIAAASEESKESLVDQQIEEAERRERNHSEGPHGSLSQWSDPSSQFSVIAFNELTFHLSQLDLRRLESYSNNLVDYHMILDIVPTLARLFFHRRLNFTLTHLQSAMLLGMGLQHKKIEEMRTEFNIEDVQVVALFNKIIRKMVAFIRGLEERSVSKEVRKEYQKGKGKDGGKAEHSAPLKPLRVSMESELSSSAKSAMRKLSSDMDLSEYAIPSGREDEWEREMKKVEDKVKKGEAVSISISSDGNKGKDKHKDHKSHKSKDKEERHKRKRDEENATKKKGKSKH